ncbi:MAG: aspartate aminotransferase family protein [Peptococcales bacterium]|jgi:taurine-pyruvate aminotransferase
MALNIKNDYLDDIFNYDPAEMIQQDKDHVWHHLTQHKIFETNDPMVIVEGNGLRLKDIKGREFLDAVSGGVWCVNVGYGRESIAEAVYQQLKVMPYYAGSAGNIPAIKYAKKLTTLLPKLQKVYFSNSGSEANEKAFKMVRQSFRLKYPGKEKIKILYRNKDYHGTTLGALSATGQEERRMDFGPFVPGFVEFPHACCYRCHFGKTYPECNIDCARVVEDIILQEGPDTVGAVFVEPITAGGGVIPPVKEYYPILQEICKKYDVLMIMDEVVCGFGRTGKMFGHEHYDVDPDIVTMAKGTASSYAPVSVTMAKEDLFNVFKNDPSEKLAYFRDISTYGGCAGGFAAGLENIRIIEDEKLCENSAKLGEYMLEGLKELLAFPIVGDVRGKGLFAGIELVEDKESKTPVSEAFIGKVIGDITAQGVLVGRTNRSFVNQNNIMNVAPALIATKDDIDEIVNAIKNSLEKNSK